MANLETRSVQMPSSFFKSSKREYKDWRFAMVREFVQNSYDAGAATIRFTIDSSAQGHTVLTVADDGTGMDEDTLVNVLLCLGGSRKPDGAVGGFGYAKTILLLAHHSYSVCTVAADGMCRVVKGSGGTYTYTAHPAIDESRGTSVTVEIDDSRPPQDWADTVRRYASLCCMEYFTGRAVRIVLSGTELPQNNATVYGYEVDSDAGYVWYNEVGDGDPKVSTFVVHVKGLPMFIEEVHGSSSKVQLSGGIELAAGSLALTSNRDGLTWEHHQRFKECLTVIVRRQSSLRYGDALSLQMNFSEGDIYAGRVAIPIEDAGGWTPVARQGQGLHEAFAGLFDRIDIGRYPANFHVKVDSLAQRRKVGSEAYVTKSALSGQLGKLRLSKYAHAWRAAVHTVLMCQLCLDSGVAFWDPAGRRIGETDWGELTSEDLIGLTPYFHGVRVDTGFCFIEKVEGLCSRPTAGPIQILCNPWLIPAEDSLSLRYAWMLDLAIHEVNHLWVSDHNEEFAARLDLLRQSLRRWLPEAGSIATVAGAVHNRFRNTSESTGPTG
ncbi:hypothetical protein FN976_20460 [Caenimonas sedimenti]|uniref:Uncharacterized protein n=1 Tax=Caenimonas sedimenti TaxID=2596921 RepID=A0A562ZKJ9_9BURK|nr:ATP-binding protein [Caenimonas sedimenti]TWO69110.1 hypothetical protein FN976_20460 [Caenimonas sedimenti]